MVNSDMHQDGGSSRWDMQNAQLPAVMRRNERRVRAGFWNKLKKFISHIPFAEDAVAAYFCATDRQTPMRVRGVLLGALAYFIMPLDMVPDFIAGLGFSDDATVLATALGLVASHMKPQHRAWAREVINKMRNSDGHSGESRNP